MTIRLDRTIVPAKDRTASAQFLAEVFGLTVKVGRFAQVRVNDTLTFDFTDETQEWRGFRSRVSGRPDHHYAFVVGKHEFDTILGRVKAKGILYGSEPHRPNGQTYTHRGGRGVYLEDPDGHLLEVMTRPEVER